MNFEPQTSHLIYQISWEQVQYHQIPILLVKKKKKKLKVSRSRENSWDFL